MPSEFLLKCVTCGKEYKESELEYTCPHCGPLMGTLEVIYDLDAIKKSFTKEHLSQCRDYSHWRYLALLPIHNSEAIPALSTGWTPIYRNHSLEMEFGIHRIYVKDDGRNPSASYKDRASSLALVKALEKGYKVLTAASTGNAASSWSAYTALAGLKTIIFVPESIPQAKLAQLLLYGAEVLQIKGSYDDAFDLCCQAAEKWGWYNRSTAINPYLGEGKKTGAFEICEQLNWNVADYVFVAVGDGCIYQALAKGFSEMYQLGFIDKIPKLVGVQAEGASPLVKAWNAKLDKVKPENDVKTLADSISVGVPRDQIKALKAAKSYSGEFISVSDEDILNSIALLAKTTGVLAEPAGATAMAGLYHYLQNNRIASNSSVLAINTGNGLKDIQNLMKSVKNKPVFIANSIESVPFP